jgi:glyoxylase-like metal-dependent hydrolase (beta-lactamase superfamily II)
MKLSFHYCGQGLSNCYMVGGEGGSRDALIIDPGSMDKTVLDFIENNEYILKGILLTNNHANHVDGLRSLKRIYGSAEIYSANSEIMGYKTNVARDGDIINIGSLSAEAVSVPGHSIDSMVYVIDQMLFTGDVLSAGMTGRTDSAYSAIRQITAIQNKIFTLRKNYVVLPGHGPPTTLRVERDYNIGVRLFEEKHNMTRHTSFSLDLFDNSTV